MNQVNQEEVKKRSLWSIIISAIYGLSAAAFLVALFLLDVLPLTYFAAVAAVMVLLSALMVRGLLFSKHHKKKHVACALVAAILSLALIAGTAMISGTMSFFNDILAGSQSYDYHVVVRGDSSFGEVSDIENETVSVLDIQSSTQESAKEELQKEVAVVFKSEEGLSDMTKGLLEGKTNVLLLSSAYYDMAIEEDNGFTEETTRILKTYQITVEGTAASSTLNPTKEPFSVYVSGIDTTGSISNASRSDVNMVMTVNPTERKILLTSIPRDYYVTLHSYGALDKLTHAGIYGPEESKATIEDLLGMDIQYYLKVNFTTVTSLVDALGGITVYSDYAFTSRDGFYYTEGENYLNGEQALSFVRERKAFSEGDRQRVKNQQAVISGIINKVTGSTAILTQYNDLLVAIADNIEISMTAKDMKSLVKMQLSDMRGWDIESCSLDGTGSTEAVYSIPGAYAYVMIPDPASIEEVKAEISAVINGTPVETESADGADKTEAE
ncbi:MAG: LCP family protein [Firmicutes bacterium]|nr:LCP family protein [Bacillota bacterium]